MDLRNTRHGMKADCKLVCLGFGTRYIRGFFHVCRLTGRATVQFVLEKGDGSLFTVAAGGGPQKKAEVQVRPSQICITENLEKIWACLLVTYNHINMWQEVCMTENPQRSGIWSVMIFLAGRFRWLFSSSHIRELRRAGLLTSVMPLLRLAVSLLIVFKFGIYLMTCGKRVVWNWKMMCRPGNARKIWWAETKERGAGSSFR